MADTPNIPEGPSKSHRLAPLPRSGEARPERQSERRVVTILFCDVTNSTALAEQLDPEEWAEMMDVAFDYLIAPVHHYEGTVARLMGDAILAFLGAPTAHEDDPQRAVAAGLDILEEIKPFCEQVRQDYGLDFNVRVGINTGSVVVGEIGSQLATEYTAMGDAVNLAARMEQTAAPGTLQVAPDTYKLVSPLFDCIPLGEIQVKGKSEPVMAYRVTGRKEQTGRLRGIEGLSAPLVGRAQEMETFNRCLADLRQGRGQIVCLIGEAGLGKSRLIEEWHTADLLRVESRGIAYEATRPYGLFQQHLRRLCGGKESDSPEVARQRLASRLAELAPGLATEPQRAVEVALGLSREAEGTQVEGEALKRELFESMYQFWQEAAGHQPAVLVFDDLHWADMASIDLLLHLFPLTDERPTLFLCAFRPERQSPAWQVKQRAETDYPHRYTEIVLRPLTNEESDTLVDSLLAVADLPPKLHQLILRKAEGNPFFVEEVARELIESGALVRHEIDGQVTWRVAREVEDIAIPDNLQALLVARLDRLEKETRRTLEMAAVIGRSFHYRVLKLVSDAAMALDRQLSLLQRLELIREATRLPELTYLFRHELTRDAVYDSIIHRRRRALHRQVGLAMETLFGERVEQEAFRLAYHFYEAGDKERALKYSIKAGDEAARLYANQEAIMHYSRAIELARSVTITTEQLSYLYTRRGRTMEYSGDYDAAQANYQELEGLARQSGNRPLELAAILPWATIHSTFTSKFDVPQGRMLSERALMLARELGDYRAEASALWNLMLLMIFGRLSVRQAISYGEQALTIARQHNLRRELAYVLHDISRPYANVGRTEDALAALKEADHLWRELNNLPMLADSLTSYSLMLFILGQYEEALQFGQEALQLSRRIDSAWGQAYSLMTVGLIYLEQGQIDDGVQAFIECQAMALKANFFIASVWSRIMLARAYGELGMVERGLPLAQEALSLSADSQEGQLYCQAILAMLHVENNNAAEAFATIQATLDPESLDVDVFWLVPLADAMTALGLGELNKVLAITESGLQWLKSLAARPFKAQLLRLRAQALARLGRPDEAHSILLEAQAEAEELNGRLALWRILNDLVTLEQERGNPIQAEQWRRRGRDVVHYISHCTSDLELRAAFLALPAVRTLLEV
ncbi:MAG: adenylate/guanylate cyclase domain-containing protein [Chloroflexota bacterium]